MNWGYHYLRKHPTNESNFSQFSRASGFTTSAKLMTSCSLGRLGSASPTNRKVWTNAELYCSPPIRNIYIYLYSYVYIYNMIYTSFQLFPQSCGGGTSLSVPNLSFESLFQGAQGWLLCQLDLPKVTEVRFRIIHGKKSVVFFVPPSKKNMDCQCSDRIL